MKIRRTFFQEETKEGDNREEDVEWGRQDKTYILPRAVVGISRAREQDLLAISDDANVNVRQALEVFADVEHVRGQT